MKKIDIYCDECRQDLISNKKIISEHNKYIVLGGIWVENIYRDQIKNSIKDIKRKHNVNGEFKWKCVSTNKLNFYKDLINLFFEIDNISFRAIVIDAQTIDLNTYHKNSQELGFYKFYYQLLEHWIEKENKYKIFLDNRSNQSKSRAYDLKKCINNHLRIETIDDVQFINSKESLLLQLEDVIMGAVGYKYNYVYSGKSVAKNEIVQNIEKYHKIEETTRKEKKFNIFKIKLRGDKLDE